MADILSEEGMEQPIEITPEIITKNEKLTTIIKGRVDAYRELKRLIDERSAVVQDYSNRIAKAEADIKKLDDDAIVEFDK